MRRWSTALSTVAGSIVMMSGSGGRGSVMGLLLGRARRSWHGQGATGATAAPIVTIVNAIVGADGVAKVLLHLGNEAAQHGIIDHRDIEAEDVGPLGRVCHTGLLALAPAQAPAGQAFATGGLRTLGDIGGEREGIADTTPAAF